jgi:hypothetical protein
VQPTPQNGRCTKHQHNLRCFYTVCLFFCFFASRRVDIAELLCVCSLPSYVELKPSQHRVPFSMLKYNADCFYPKSSILLPLSSFSCHCTTAH